MKRDLMTMALDDVVTFGSVCSGIEAATVAWHDLGWRAAWLAEIEPYPRALLAYHYPAVPNLGNMLMIPAMLRNGDIPAPDVFTGGTPCQAFSIAGLRNSLGDARGNLSLTFCEIADEIDIQRAANGLLPCVVKWENVPGVLTTEDNAFGCFLAGLAGEDKALVPEPCPAAGKSGKFWKWNKKTSQHTLSWPKSGCVIGPQRAVAWRVLDAQYHALAQRRQRVFVVASAREGFDPIAVLFEFDGVRRDTPPSRSTGQDVAGTLNARTDGGGFPGTDEASSGYIQPVVHQAIDLRNGAITGQVAQTIQAGGHGVDPGGMPHVFSVALRGREGGATAELGDDVATCLRASAGGGDKPHVLAPIAFDSRQDCVSSTDVFGALSSSSPQAQAVSYAIQAGALRENPLSGPDGVGVQSDVAYTLEARSEVQAVCCGSGDGCLTAWDPQSKRVYDAARAEYAPALSGCDSGGGRYPPAYLTDTTGAMCAHVYSGGMGGRVDMAAQGYVQPVGMAVRRLLPVECEALQGFPRGYTDIPFRGKPAADGPRYKALGNSWAVPVVRRIGARIDAQLRAGATA